MKIRTLFIVNSILATFFGLGFLLVPDFLFKLLGFSTAADGPLAMRFFGIAVLGVSSRNCLPSLHTNSNYSLTTQSTQLGSPI